MDSKVESLLKGIGVSATIIGVGMILGVSFLAYKNYYELKKIKLDILKSQKELGLPLDKGII